MRSLGKLNASLWSTNKFLTNKKLIIWLLVALSLSASLALADSPGDLDPTFGSGGIVTTPIGDGSTTIYDAVLQTDGKVVIAGNVDIGLQSTVFVARYNTDGSLDGSFNGNGFVVTDLGDGASMRALGLDDNGKIIGIAELPIDEFAIIRYNSNGALDTSFGSSGVVTSSTNAGDLVIQDDGKIIVLGGASSGGITLTRYNDDGSLDTSFGSSGVSSTNLGSSDYAKALTIQSDGKIVVAGDDGDTGIAFTLVRYNSDGSLDTSFDSDGIVTTDLGGGSFSSYFNNVALTIQNDNKIVVTSSRGIPNADFAVARYSSDGSLDTSFDNDGVVTTNYDNGGSASSIAVQNDGKLIVAGVTDSNFGVVRFNSDGSLDTSFDNDGIAMTAIENTDYYAEVNSVLVQNNNQIVVAGFRANQTLGTDLVLVRYEPNGSPDVDYGNNGVIIDTLGKGGSSSDGVAFQSDGKIVVAGTAYDKTTSSVDFALARYTGNGSLDTSFGVDGITTTDLNSNSYDYVSSIELQSDGKIIVVGHAFTDQLSATIVRYNSNGSLDTTFGANGFVISSSADSSYVAVALQTDGKIIAGGDSSISGGTWDGKVVLVRYNPNGLLDTTFGNGGTVLTEVSNASFELEDVVVLNNGKIIVAGAIYPSGGTSDFALAQYQPNGVLDTSFDSDGIVTTSFGGDYARIRGIGIQNDGKIVAVGNTVGQGDDFTLARYNSNGALDNSFGTNGKVITDFDGQDDFANSVLIQSDGKIVAAGRSEENYNDVFALARYNPEGSLDSSFGSNGRITTSISGNYDEIAEVIVQNDGKLVAAGRASGNFALARYLNDLNNIVAVSPTSGGTLQQPSTGLSGTVGLTLTVPGGAVTQDTTLVFNNQSASGNPTTGFSLGGIVFSLEAFVNNVQQPNFTFNTPATLTFTYSDADVAGLPDGESSLELRYWDGSAWSPDGVTKVSHDVDANTITFQITHLTEFALLGPASSNTNTYVPIILK